MGKFALNRLMFTNRLHNVYLENFLLRFYEQLISGVWAVLLVLPLEETLDNLFSRTIRSNGYCSWKYLALCIVFTILLVLSSIALPNIRKMKLRRELYNSLKTDKIKTWQKEKIRKILNDSLMCKSFFSSQGFWQFIMVNFFNIGVMSAYFAIEKAVGYMAGNQESLWPALLFAIIFLTFAKIGWLTDNLLTARFLKSSAAIVPYDACSDSSFCDTKPLLVNLLKLITKDSLESKFNEALIEDAIDDISEILTISGTKKS